MSAAFAVIFDLNGTLVDTEKLYHEAYRRVLDPQGIDFTISDFTEFWTKRGLNLADYLTATNKEELISLVPKLLIDKDRIFQDLIKTELSAMEGAQQLVTSLKEKGMLLGLDSSTTKENILAMLNSSGLKNIFTAIASGDMELDKSYGNKKDKSARLKYLADQLGMRPENTVVIGDADKDLRGAKAAGMKFVAVPNCYTSDQDLSTSDLQVSSLADLNYDRVCQCFAVPKLV